MSAGTAAAVKVLAENEPAVSTVQLADEETSAVLESEYSAVQVKIALVLSGTLIGPVIGAAVFLFLEELVWRSFLTFHAGVLGLVVVFLVLFLPTGLPSMDFRKLFSETTNR